MDGLAGIADRHGLKIIYDAAHAFGTRINGRGIGTFGDVTMFSFHATKLFHTAEGGALTCSDASLKARIDDLRNFGIHDPDAVEAIGINGKMSELQAALGLCVLDGVAEELAQRRRLLARYREHVAGIDGVTWLHGAARRGRHELPVLRHPGRREAFGCSRDTLHRELKDYNVFTRKYFFPLCSNYDCYRDLPSAAASNLPVATRAVQEVLCLPLYGASSRGGRRPHLRDGGRDWCSRSARRCRGRRGMKRISFVIPVYRNERAVTLTYQRIRQRARDRLVGLRL